MTFNYINLFTANERKKDYREGEDKTFLIEIRDEEYIHVGREIFSFGTNDKIVNYSSDLGFSDIKLPFAYGKERIYLMLHQELFLFKIIKLQQKKRV